MLNFKHIKKVIRNKFPKEYVAETVNASIGSLTRKQTSSPVLYFTGEGILLLRFHTEGFDKPFIKKESYDISDLLRLIGEAGETIIHQWSGFTSGIIDEETHVWKLGDRFFFIKTESISLEVGYLPITVIESTYHTTSLGQSMVTALIAGVAFANRCITPCNIIAPPLGMSNKMNNDLERIGDKAPINFIDARKDLIVNETETVFDGYIDVMVELNGIWKENIRMVEMESNKIAIHTPFMMCYL